MQIGPKRREIESSKEFLNVPERVKSVTFTAPVIPGRPLIEGRAGPTFPAFFRAHVEPVTFREVSYFELPRETIEEIYLLFVAKTLVARRTMVVLVPRHVRARFEDEPFWYGFTVIEHDDELYTFQRVVLRSAEAIPKGGCDQGGLYEFPIGAMSAWDEMTDEQSQRQAA